jgi:3-hydroxyisobutyrate dehydrogenase-like beta-hydroxyacid dehydrogenase
MSERALGFVGVGRMGGRMCRRLIEAGYALTVYDTSEDSVREMVALGARRADSPAAVASTAEIVLASLPTPPIVHAVALGPKGISEGTRVKIFVDVSTTGSAYARRVAEGLAVKGITAVDAPVSGGVAGAERGTVAVMVSCNDATFQTVKPVLEVIGKIFHVGKNPGQGQTMKLMNNLLSATAMAITSEAAVMGVFNAGSGRNTATQDKFPRCVLPRSFDFGFALALLNKDVRLCMEEAEALGVPMVVGSAVRQMLSIATASEGPNADMTDLVKTLEKWAGVLVGG